MRGAGGEGAGLGTGPAGLAAILAAIWDRARSASRWCWVTAFRPYPADAPRMTATAAAVIILRGCCRAPAAYPAGPRLPGPARTAVPSRTGRRLPRRAVRRRWAAAAGPWPGTVRSAAALRRERPRGQPPPGPPAQAPRRAGRYRTACARWRRRRAPRPG